MKEGWKYRPLEHFCDVQNGFAFNSKLFGEEGLPLIRIRDIKRGFSETKTTELAEKEYFVENGDILIGMDGDFNIAEWKGGHALLNQRVCKLVQSSKVNSRFLMYFLPKALKEINDKTAYSTVKHLSSKQIKQINIPEIPITEQQQIVDFLDAEFAKIDELKKQAEQSLQNAKDLFQAVLKEMLTPKKGWKKAKLKELTSKIGSGATPKGGRNVYIEEGCSQIRSMNVYNYEFKYDELAHISEQAAEALRGVEIMSRDVLFNITGGSIARCCVVPDDVIPARVNQHVSILRPKDDLDSDFLCFTMISPEHQKILLEIGEAGSTRQAITKADLEEHQIDYPTIIEQKRIISEIRSALEKCKLLQSNYTRTIQLCADLKQALLRQVFE